VVGYEVEGKKNDQSAGLVLIYGVWLVRGYEGETSEKERI